MLNTVLLTIYDTVPYDWPHVIESTGALLAVGIVGAVVAVASAATSIGMSVSASEEQAMAQARAEKEAKRALESARSEMKQRKLAKLAINLEGERTAAENAAVVAATGIQTARGGDPRQLAATIGRTQMANIREQEGLQATRAKRVDDLELLKAEEEQSIQTNLANLDLAEAEGAQVAAARAADMKQAYDNQAVQGGIQAAGAAVNLAGTIAGPKIAASAAYDKGVAGAGEANIKSFLQNDPAAMSKYGSQIGSANSKALKNMMIDLYPAASFSDPVFQDKLSGDYFRDTEVSQLKSLQAVLGNR
jgi:hypothetical protein